MRLLRVSGKQLGTLLQVSDRASEAEIVLLYEGGVEPVGGMFKRRWADGKVFRPIDAHTARLLLTFKRSPEVYRSVSVTRAILSLPSSKHFAKPMVSIEAIGHTKAT